MKKAIMVCLFIGLGCAQMIFVQQVQAQPTFKPETDAATLKSWIDDAKANQEIDPSSINRVIKIHGQLTKGSTDVNHIYNFGRAIAMVIQPGFDLENHTFSNYSVYPLHT